MTETSWMYAHFTRYNDDTEENASNNYVYYKQK